VDKIRGKPRFTREAAGRQAVFGKVSLVGADVDIVQLRGMAALPLYCFGNTAPGADAKAVEPAKDRPERTLFHRADLRYRFHHAGVQAGIVKVQVKAVLQRDAAAPCSAIPVPQFYHIAGAGIDYPQAQPSRHS
jgi:hypothetical protein